MTTTVTTPRPLMIDYSVFPDVKGQLLECERSTWSELCDMLANPPEYPSKQACPLLKLATFGNVRSAKGNSLRSDANMLEVFGIEGDYDGERVSIEQGASMLGEAGIAALLYTSPRHTAEFPRWRVLAPLSRRYQPGERRRLVAMLNSALGGVLASESFTASQTFYYGKVRGAEYEAIRVMGRPLDELELGETYPKAAPTVHREVVDDRDQALDRMVLLAAVTADTLKDLRSALATNSATGKPWIDPDDRGTWVAVAHDLKCLGEPGYELWCAWSALSDKFEDGQDDPRYVWDSCQGDRADYRAVFAKAQAGSWLNPKSAQGIAAGTTAESRIDRSDMGNVNLLASLTAGDIRYVPEGKQWLCWNGSQWVPDDAGDGVQGHALQVAEHYVKQAAELYAKAQGDTLDATERKHLERAAENLTKWAVNCRNKTTVGNMLAMAKCDRRFTLSAAKLDVDPWLFGVDNGVVDLRTGTLRATSRDEYVTRRSPVAFNPDATAPRWQRFVNEITATPSGTGPDGFEYRPELAHYLQKALGYSLTGSVREQKMFIAVGGGSNGKSVLLDTMLWLLGDYGQPVAPEALMANGRDVDAERATPFKFKLAGARAAISCESKDGQQLDVAMVKQHTGGGMMTARNLHAPALTFAITHKLWLMTNHCPAIDHLDAALRGRLHIIPFDMRWNRPGEIDIDPHKPNGDPVLVDAIKAEAEGVLAWLLAGALAYQREGLSPPSEVARMTRDYFDEQDPFSQWLATYEVCDIKQGALAATLFSEFRQWCGSVGLDAALAGTQARFSLKLKAKGIKNVKIRQGITYGLCSSQRDDLA